MKTLLLFFSFFLDLSPTRISYTHYFHVLYLSHVAKKKNLNQYLDDGEQPPISKPYRYLVLNPDSCFPSFLPFLTLAQVYDYRGRLSFLLHLSVVYHWLPHKKKKNLCLLSTLASFDWLMFGEADSFFGTYTLVFRRRVQCPHYTHYVYDERDPFRHSRSHTNLAMITLLQVRNGMVLLQYLPLILDALLGSCRYQGSIGCDFPDLAIFTALRLPAACMTRSNTPRISPSNHYNDIVREDGKWGTRNSTFSFF